MADLTAFQQELGVNFNQPSLLVQALTHSSYANENPNLAHSSNERLEYLGDAVLGLMVGEKLYRDFPDLSEGDMTKLRAYLVKQETLALVARNIGWGASYIWERGRRRAGEGRSPPTWHARWRRSSPPSTLTRAPKSPSRSSGNCLPRNYNRRSVRAWLRISNRVCRSTCRGRRNRRRATTWWRQSGLTTTAPSWSR